MPYLVKKIKNKYRVIEKNTGNIAKNQAGTAVDGGGHRNKAGARKQQAALNIQYAKKQGAKIPKQKGKA